MATTEESNQPQFMSLRNPLAYHFAAIVPESCTLHPPAIYSNLTTPPTHHHHSISPSTVLHFRNLALCFQKNVLGAKVQGHNESSLDPLKSSNISSGLLRYTSDGFVQVILLVFFDRYFPCSKSDSLPNRNEAHAGGERLEC